MAVMDVMQARFHQLFHQRRVDYGSSSRSSVGSSSRRKSSRSVSRKGMLLPRPRRRKREFIAPRASGESMREWLGRNLEDSFAGYLFASFMTAISSGLVLAYVLVNWNELVDAYPPEYVIVEQCTNVMFSIEYLLHVYSAIDRFDYTLSFFPMMEFAVLLPTCHDAIVPLLGLDIQESPVYSTAQVLRSLQILRCHRFLYFTTSSLQRQILAALLTVVSITIATAGVLQVAEKCVVKCIPDINTKCGCQDLSFLDFTYFVVVSISTLGYGDISPMSKNGKALIAFMILLVFMLVPIQVNRIAAIVSSHTDYSSSYREAKRHPHVVITGHIDVDVLSMFFGEFFHASNLNWNEKIVILSPRPPTVELKKLLNTYENKVKYLVGTPMLDEDLDRAVLKKATACFVFINRNSKQPQHADQCSALITIALRRGNAHCPIYSQVIRTENAPTILKMGASDVLVVGAIKFSILGRSCEVPGLPTLLYNLLVHSHSEFETKESPIFWQKPYLHGYMHGIYLVDIPRSFSGLTFADLIRFLYERTPVIPLAMLTEEGVQFPDLDFKLGATADPTLCCKVYAIAKGLGAVETAMQISPELVLSYRKTLRRKAKTSKDLLSEDLDTHKHIRPALGAQIENIRHAQIIKYASHTHATHHRHSLTDARRGRDYEDFTTSGAPSNISKHIVVCGFPTETYEFLKSVRDVHVPGVEQSPAVVFLAPAVIDEDEYSRIQFFPHVYYVMGSPVNFADLKKTHIDRAVSVLVFTMATELMHSDENMIDADAITTLRYIVEISQRGNMPNLVVELDKSTNVKLLSSLSNDRRTSAFMRAVTLTASQEHSFKSGSKRRLSVRRESFWGMLDENGHRIMDTSLVLEDFVVSGRVYLNSILDAVMSECYRKRWISSFVDLLVNGDDLDPRRKRLFQMPAPPGMLQAKYSDCFRRLLDFTGCVAMGVWRPERGMVIPHPLVLVNPPADFIIELNDVFYLVGKPMTVEEAQANIDSGRRIDG